MEMQTSSERQNPNRPMTPCTQPSSISASLTSGEQAEVAILVRQCFDVLDTFGKTPDQLTNIIKAFVTQLAEYRYEQVRMAFRAYIKRNAVMPKPADIINLIDPPKAEWRPDWSAYNALKKRVQQDGAFLYGSEREF